MTEPNEESNWSSSGGLCHNVETSTHLLPRQCHRHESQSRNVRSSRVIGETGHELLSLVCNSPGSFRFQVQDEGEIRWGKQWECFEQICPINTNLFYRNPLIYRTFMLHLLQTVRRRSVCPSGVPEVISLNHKSDPARSSSPTVLHSPYRTWLNLPRRRLRMRRRRQKEVLLVDTRPDPFPDQTEICTLWICVTDLILLSMIRLLPILLRSLISSSQSYLFSHLYSLPLIFDRSGEGVFLLIRSLARTRQSHAYSHLIHNLCKISYYISKKLHSVIASGNHSCPSSSPWNSHHPGTNPISRIDCRSAISWSHRSPEQGKYITHWNKSLFNPCKSSRI